MIMMKIIMMMMMIMMTMIIMLMIIIISNRYNQRSSSNATKDQVFCPKEEDEKGQLNNSFSVCKSVLMSPTQAMRPYDVMDIVESYSAGKTFSATNSAHCPIFGHPESECRNLGNLVPRCPGHIRM